MTVRDGPQRTGKVQPGSFVLSFSVAGSFSGRTGRFSCNESSGKWFVRNSKRTKSPRGLPGVVAWFWKWKILRRALERITSPVAVHPSSRQAGVCTMREGCARSRSDHAADSFSKRSTRDAHVFALDSRERTKRMVEVFSTLRRNRNHTFKGIWRTSRGGASLKS